MRLMKSLLCAVSALLLAAGTAFANQDWMSERYSGPQSDESFSAVSGSSGSMNNSMSMAEADVIYIYPVEVTEYYLLIPSESREMPG